MHQAQGNMTCIHQIIESQAVKNPDRIALICDDLRLSYAELDKRANQVARRLKTVGVGPEVLVGLCVERSLAMGIGLLGILKAGGVYVPFDPSYPEGRLAFMLADTMVPVILTQKKLDAVLPLAERRPHIIYVDSDGSPVSHDQGKVSMLRAGEVTADHLAYVMYTSGSEGRPKGVMVTHGNLCHYVRAIALAMGVGPEDAYLHIASISFASSARQLIMPLCHGATVVMVTSDQRRDPIKVLELVKRHGVTIMDMVPPYWRLLNASLERLDAESRDVLLDNKLRFVNAHGDVLQSDIPGLWRRKFGYDASILNMYGQTETTGVVAVYPIPPRGEDSAIVPVGRPIAGTRIHVLDESLRPVPDGVRGELYVGGPGVARGYLNSPDLTNERFIPDPFSSDSCARLYKTGDFGRQRLDGVIEVSGRMDQQIKINGIRIELGEIEVALAQHRLVQEAVVLACEMENGERRLVAYYKPTAEGVCTDGDLRDFLKDRLPSYMVPSAFVSMETMPLTPNSKIDRHALPKPDFSRGASSMAFVPPRDRLEEQVAAVWEEALGIHPIGMDDNFLELGGDSLLALHIVTEMDRRFSRQVAPASLFQKPTVREMANLLRGEEDSPLPDCIVPIQRGSSKTPLFCIHALGKGLGFYGPLARCLGSQQTLYGTSTSLTVDSGVPHQRDIKGLATYYLRAIQTVQPQGPYCLVGVSFGGVVAYEIAQQLCAQGHGVRLLGLLDSYCPVKATLSSIRGRLLRHLSNLGESGPRYLLSRIQRRLVCIQSEIQLVEQRLGWLDSAVEQELHDELGQLRARHEHRKVNRNYQMRVYPGRITLFRSMEDPDPKLDWSRFAGGGLTVYDIPGGHIGMLGEAHAPVLAQKLKESLGE